MRSKSGYAAGVHRWSDTQWSIGDVVFSGSECTHYVAFDGEDVHG